MKKGISELISYVLLVGFAITIGTFVILWAIGIFENPDFEDPRINCPQVSLSLESYCRYTDSSFNPSKEFLNLSIYNRGSFNITKLTIYKSETRRGINESDSKDVDPNPSLPYLPLSPGSNMLYRLELEEVSSYLYEVTITPWISLNISCPDQKLVVTKTEDLNRICS